ncbi:MAG: hypothetical protein K1X54_05420 [Flavobacteriales bacterium]|nr:hypothetical protein [Flavobacteriales bacterium]
MIASIAAFLFTTLAALFRDMTGQIGFFHSIQLNFEKRPLLWIIFLAAFVRLIAVIFAKGYLMHDDHFLTIEPSGSWADGSNFNNWLPGIGNDLKHPEPISFFYLGWLFCFFKVMLWMGIDQPDTQMYIIRLIHAAYSLITVWLGYRIAERLGGQKRAITVGLLLAFIGVLPNFSVRNLVEMVCIPPLMYGFYVLIKSQTFTTRTFFGREFTAVQTDVITQKGNGWWSLIIAAFVMGLAVGLRYQTGLLVAMTGVMLWLFVGFSRMLVFGVVSLLAFSVTQLDDVLLWGGEPFQHLQGYFEYNKKNALNYPGSPFAYLSFIGLFILPPVSLFLLFGFLSSWRKHALVVFPVVGFILFHILYPNRQERFILPALPFVVMMGVLGWYTWKEKSMFWKQREGLHRGLWRFFWVINTVLMLVFCFTFSKKGRVEAMNYLYEQGDCRNFALEFTHSDQGAMMPQFYSGNWSIYYYWKKGDEPWNYMLNFAHDEETTQSDLRPRLTPNYYLFYDDLNLEQRVAHVREYYPALTYQTTIEAGWFDQLLHRLNPKNSLEKIHIYKVPDLNDSENGKLPSR